MKKHILMLITISLILLYGCEPIVNTFDDGDSVKKYSSKEYQEPEAKNEIKFMTWNIRFGVGRTDWFGDACGDRVIVPKNEVIQNLQKIVDFINAQQPDILFLQEVDILSKRTEYVDQVEWILNNTYFNYAAYSSMWEAQYIPSDGLGRVDVGNAILSRWKIEDPSRVALPLRGDQDALTEFFYMRRNLLKARIDIPDVDDFYALCVHMSAFSTDDTKQRQMETIVGELESLEGKKFFLGGDFNLIPPGSDSIDFCHEDACAGDEIHVGNPTSEDYHKEGSYFGNEIDLLQPLYDNYNPAVPLDHYLSNQENYFTHSTQWDGGFWDRKLDYFFTNLSWKENSDATYQIETYDNELSDHVPVSVIWEVSK